MEHLRNDWSEFAKYAKEFITEPLTIIDIGCSGGIDEILKNFGDKIIYYGFDPNIKEIERLKANNKNPNISYIESYIDCRSEDIKNNSPASVLSNDFKNLSAAEGAKIISKSNADHKSMVENNLWNEMQLTSKNTKITEFVKEKNLKYIDFIKSDIDGLDLSFFKSCQEILEPMQVLSVVAEVSFACNINDEADLTLLLKKHGFGLNLLSTRNYSSKYLPDLYALNIAAQTISGRIIQGDALYIKDEKY